MSRSKWKLKYLAPCLLKNQYKKHLKNKFWNRSSIIPSFLENKNVFVYNGKVFKKIFITREKIGYKFGEFALTKTSPKNTKVLNKKLQKKSK